MNQFMKIAINEAKKGISLGHGGPFGAVIVKDGKIISKGHNHVVVNNDPTCHGEIDAIRKACKTLKTFDLSGYRFKTKSWLSYDTIHLFLNSLTLSARAV